MHADFMSLMATLATFVKQCCLIYFIFKDQGEKISWNKLFFSISIQNYPLSTNYFKIKHTTTQHLFLSKDFSGELDKNTN